MTNKNEQKPLERIQRVRLPFDGRADDPKKNYGIGSLIVWFILKGDKGAVQFQFSFTHALLPHVQRDHTLSGWLRTYETIMGYDVGYHARTPQFDGHEPMKNECDLTGGKCYCDGSSLRAQEWVDQIFSSAGMDHEKVIWERLEAEYRERFGE